MIRNLLETLGGAALVLLMVAALVIATKIDRALTAQANAVHTPPYYKTFTDRLPGAPSYSEAVGQAE